ncbi:MAG: hypothetical protein IKU25_03000 [Clostridia bacterium]|nr:hypothetical protein [Clostridia bacterium]
MKKIFSALSERGDSSDILAIPVILLALVLSIFVLIFYVPIDYVKYKRSLYCKNTNQKYRLFMGTNPEVVLYDIVYKNSLPIEYVAAPEKSEREIGWFVYNNTLIIPSCYDFSFDSEKNQWFYECENESFLTLDEYMEVEISDVNKFFDRIICDKAIVLIKRGQISRSDTELAEKDERFLIYDKKVEDVIYAFCAS